ncbi:MAG TPA: dihydropteroate synthase [Actinomycetota bacterium]|nr:dihydropteroate synthase [Actinomycetota bacterium]
MNPERCLVMGILNRTPDSFFDGGRMALTDAVAHGIAMVEQGADIIDVGAVKAGPGPHVDEAEEIARLIPLVRELKSATQIPLSIETSSPRVAEEAFEVGASILNDVTGLADPALAKVCAGAQGTIVLMHHGGQLRGRPRHPRYEDVVVDVIETWKRLADEAVSAGVDPGSIVVDPGLDFGKTTFHSLELVRRLDELVACGWPVLVAPSNKDVVGETLGLPLDQRLEGTLALVALSAQKGAAIVRVHDVRPAVRAVAMVEAVVGHRPPVAPLRGLWD